MEKALNPRQLSVLGWISDGCPDGVMRDDTYKNVARALEARRLATVSRKGGIWKATATDAGRHYLKHRRYPKGHWGEKPASTPSVKPSELKARAKGRNSRFGPAARRTAAATSAQLRDRQIELVAFVRQPNPVPAVVSSPKSAVEDAEERRSKTRTWQDALPWLQSAERSTDFDWLNELIEDSGPEGKRERFKVVSEIALTELVQWTIGRILPTLPGGISLFEIGLPSRAVNAFDRLGYATTRDLVDLRLDDLMSWRHVGVGTVRTILQVLTDTAVRQTPTFMNYGADQSGMGFVDIVRLPRPMTHVIEDLERVASWYQLTGRVDTPLFEEPAEPGFLPEEVAASLSRLTQMNVRTVSGRDAVGTGIAHLLNAAMTAFDDRAIRILRERHFAPVPKTLDELSVTLGIGKERVRQIERQCQNDLKLRIAGQGSIATVARAVRGFIAPVLRLDQLLDAVPALGQTVELVGQPAWRVLERIDGNYQISDGWCARPSLSDAKETTRAQIQERVGLSREDETPLTGVLAVRADIRDEWLRFCGFAVIVAG